VRLLYPITPPKVLAVGLNYKSHIGDRPVPTSPEIFYKPITALQNPGDPIRIPADSKNTHYEGELVLVIGPGASIFGVIAVTRSTTGLSQESLTRIPSPHAPLPAI